MVRPVVAITALEAGALAWIADRARPVDRAEFAATVGPNANPAAWAQAVARSAVAGGIAWHGDRPAAALAVVPLVDGVGEAVMMATPAWRAVARTTTAWVQGELIPTLLRAGFRRVEARVRADRRAAVAWCVAHFGGRLEAELADIGRNGERFVQIAWCRSALLPVDPVADPSTVR